MATIFSQDVSTPSVPFDSYTPRVAIVTGAAQGIGYAIAQRLAEDGIDVAINDIADKQKQIDSVVQEIRKKGRRAISIPGDVSSETEVISMIEKTSSELGGVDIVGSLISSPNVCSCIASLDGRECGHWSYRRLHRE